MADGSCVQPTDIMEDILVRVDKIFVPNNFVVIEGLINLTIGDEEMKFQFNKTMKEPSMRGWWKQC